MSARLCERPDCGKPHKARGLCPQHYQAWRISNPVPARPTVTERFWAKVEKSDGCWLWRGRINHGGYGRFDISPGDQVMAHRHAYMLVVGEIPAGLQLDHLCRVRHCVRPEHLEPVTQRVNLLRGVGFSALAAAKTHCQRGHEFTPENTMRNRRGHRRCRECNKTWQRGRGR